VAQQSRDGDSEQPEASSWDPVRLSKLLSFLLRHRPDSIGLTLSSDGWVEVGFLLERINAERKLPYRVTPSHLERLVDESSRFQLRDGRVRARTGHSVRVSIPRDTEPGDPVPEFLFAMISAEAASRGRDDQHLEGAAELVLAGEEPTEGDGVLAVVEAARARRGGVSFERVTGGFRARKLPLRYVISLRRGYERQISAGGVLVRGRGADAQFALIRTRPRSETQVTEPAEFEDPRESSDRRGTDRRRGEGTDAPAGVDRRRGSRRRQRRRRSGRWGKDGRLELPKGKLEPGETPEQAAVREVQEELGVVEELSVSERLSFNNYVFRTPDGKPIFKTVHYFLLRCVEHEPAFDPALAEGIVGVEWWAGERAIAQVAFANLRPVLEKAWELVQ
jgi:putative RNA 2'-phosphotransferase